MTVELWFQPSEPLYPGGYRSTYGSLEDALGEAVDLANSGRTPRPDRIVDTDSGEILADRTKIEKAAKAAK